LELLGLAQLRIELRLRQTSVAITNEINGKRVQHHVHIGNVLIAKKPISFSLKRRFYRATTSFYEYIN
jgi:predicted HAD superfamily phosphohydrolase YqeG